MDLIHLLNILHQALHLHTSALTDFDALHRCYAAQLEFISYRFSSPTPKDLSFLIPQYFYIITASSGPP